MLMYQNMMSFIRKWIVEMYTVFPVAVGNRSIDRYFLPNGIKYRVWHGTWLTRQKIGGSLYITLLNIIRFGLTYEHMRSLWPQTIFIRSQQNIGAILVDFSFVLLRRLLAVIILCFFLRAEFDSLANWYSSLVLVFLLAIHVYSWIF